MTVASKDILASIHIKKQLGSCRFCCTCTGWTTVTYARPQLKWWII